MNIPISPGHSDVSSGANAALTSSEEQLERLLSVSEYSTEQLFSVLNRRGMLEGILACFSDQALMAVETSCLEKLFEQLSVELKRRDGTFKRRS